MKVLIDHIGLNVENIEDSINFYQKILEFKIERLEEFEKGLVGFPSVRINEDSLIDLFPPKMWNATENNELTNRNLNHFCLTCSEQDWQRLYDRLRLNNIEIIRYSDNNWGAKGRGISIYFNDVDSNEIEARYYQN